MHLYNCIWVSVLSVLSVLWNVCSNQSITVLFCVQTEELKNPLPSLATSYTPSGKVWAVSKFFVALPLFIKSIYIFNYSCVINN